MILLGDRLSVYESLLLGLFEAFFEVLRMVSLVTSTHGFLIVKSAHSLSGFVFLRSIFDLASFTLLVLH